MPRLTTPILRIALVALAAVLWLPALPVYGQGAVFTYSVRTKSYDGEIKQVRGSRLVWESDGKTGPIPVNRDTILRVTGTGDTGFIKPNCVVTVTGTLQPNKTITGAEMQVHLNPKQTASMPKRVTVEEADPQIRITGRLISMSPPTIKAIDGISISSGGQTDRAASGVAPPVFGAVLPFKLREANAETVGLLLGSTPQLIAPGDYARVTVTEDNPNVAYSVYVRKSEPMSSGRTKPDADDDDDDDTSSSDD